MTDLTQEGITLLPTDYTPGPHDVIIGRGKRCYNHRGNERFRTLVQSHLDEYTQAKTKTHKSQIISSIVQHIRDRSPHVGFCKQVEGLWYAVEDTSARITTSQAFRDALSDQYKSSRQFKQKKRRLELEGDAAHASHIKKRRNSHAHKNAPTSLTLQDLYHHRGMPALAVPPMVVTTTPQVHDAPSEVSDDAVKDVFTLLVDRFLPLHIDPLDDPFEPAQVIPAPQEPQEPSKGGIPMEYLQFFLEPTPLSEDCCAAAAAPPKSSAPMDYAFKARAMPSRNAPTARTA